MEAVANARADTLLTAYAKAKVPIDDQAVVLISAEVDKVCDARRGSILDSMQLYASRTGGGASISGQITNEASRVKAEVRRKLLAKRDEATLESRSAPMAAEAKELDSLLPLFTKKQFAQDLSVLVASAGTAAPLSALFIDLDHFKDVNDTYGHPVGDEVLIGTTTALKAACAGKGHCYRWGGEELVVLLSNYNSAEAAALAERIREAIGQLQFSGYPNQVTASIGVASYPEISATAEALVKAADDAMYSAKQAGRDRVVVAGSFAEANLRPQEETPRLSAAEKGKRVEAAQATVRIEQGIAENFVVVVRNDSNDELTLKEIRLLSNDIRLTDPARPHGEAVWKVQPKGGTLPIGWRAQPDPTGVLEKMNPNKGVKFTTEVKVILCCEILGQTKLFESKLFVQVDRTRRSIAQLAG
jgi:diguanylate cyclase (GGDEF)-like protein